jgi:hypothetical protein
MNTSRSRLTYANVVSTLALLLVLTGGGAALAAVTKNSVGSSQIRNGAIKGKDVKTDTLTSKQIRDSTLTNASIVSGRPSGSGTLGVTPTIVASVTLTAPSSGVILLLAEAEFSATVANSVLDVRILEGETEWYSGEWDAGDVDGLYDLTQNSSVVVPVTAGTHTYRLRLGGEADYLGARLTAVFAAQGTATPPVT